MTIVHPQQPVNGLNPEDVFYAVDDLGTQTGYGFILYQMQPGLYPDCPVNLYFSIAGTDQILQLAIPFGDGRIPMSCTVAPTPLNTWDEQNSLIYRLQMNEITFVDMNYLNSLRRMPHFMTLGLYRNAVLIGEVIMAGQGSDCELVAIYIEPGSRNQGMGRALLHRMMAIMAAEGVTRVTTRIMSRSLPQQRLAADFNATVLGVNMLFPGMYLN